MIPRFRSAALAAFAALICALPGCGSTQTVGENATPQPLGSVQAGSPDLGSTTFDPGVCLSGEREMFLGADFLDHDRELVLRIVWDPLAGPAVRVFDRSDPSVKSIVFRQADCRQFNASVDPTNWRINDVDEYRVSADVDCGDPKNGFVRARVSAAHCR